MNNNTLELPPVRSGSALANVEGKRAMQEIQAALMMGKSFPRDEKSALDKILNACSRIGLAEQAAYSYSKGGTDITGPSIRLAEAVAQYWGNIRTGVVEISRSTNDKGVTVSEAKAYAWDVETNFYEEKLFSVPHWRDTRQGGYAIKEERDIYELVANMGSRRKRACLLAVIPGDVIEEAARQCDVTLKAKADTSPEAVLQMIEAFKAFGVTKAQIEKRIQRRTDSIVPAQVISLRRIYRSLLDGMSAATDWFEVESTASTRTEPLNPMDENRDSRFVNEADERASLNHDIKNTCLEKDTTIDKFLSECRTLTLLGEKDTLQTASIELLRHIHDSRLAIVNGEYGKEES